MKKLLSDNGLSFPVYFINILLLIYPKLSGTVWETGTKSINKEIFPVEFDIPYVVITFIISILSIYMLFINFKAKNKIFLGFFFIGFIVILNFLLPEKSFQVTEIEKAGTEKECRGPDTSGKYMNKVYSRIRNTGCQISGGYFSGNGSYEIQAVCPSGKIGVTNIEVIVNKCGDIERVLY
jgi:hypothetical protein